jgi:hypothetical protein
MPILEDLKVYAERATGIRRHALLHDAHTGGLKVLLDLVPSLWESR